MVRIESAMFPRYSVLIIELLLSIFDNPHHRVGTI
jgi:hypothetical protein